MSGSRRSISHSRSSSFSSHIRISLPPSNPALFFPKCRAFRGNDTSAKRFRNSGNVSRQCSTKAWPNAAHQVTDVPVFIDRIRSERPLMDHGRRHRTTSPSVKGLHRVPRRPVAASVNDVQRSQASCRCVSLPRREECGHPRKRRNDSPCRAVHTA